MSMIGNFRSLSDEDVRALLEQPSRVEQLLYGEHAFPGTNGEVVSSFGHGLTPPSEADGCEQAGDGDELDVDKAWHGIHFLLTGTAWKGSFPLKLHRQRRQGGRRRRRRYGPARALMSEDVRRLNAALEPFTSEELKRRFDSEQMTRLQIYPEIWDRDPEEDDSLAYLIEYYTDLRDFVRRTADRGHGLLVYLN
jgi:hypothetical protein